MANAIKPLMTIREPFYDTFTVEIKNSRFAFALCITHGVSMIAISAVGSLFAILGQIRHLFRSHEYKEMFQQAVDGVVTGCLLIPFGIFGMISPTAVEAFKHS